jgi:hypothetical protein
VKPTNLFSKSCSCKRKIDVWRFTEISKHFWSLQAIRYFVAYIHDWFLLNFGLRLVKIKLYSPPPQNSWTPKIIYGLPRGPCIPC